MQFSRDSISVLLKFLPPESAVALRACCKHLNNLITHSQVYWFYQYKALKGAREIAGRKHVHIKPFTRQCLRWANIERITEQLVTKYPHIKEQFDTLRFALDPDTPMHRYSMYRICQQITKDHVLLIQGLDDVECGIDSHMTIVYDKNPKIGENSCEIAKEDGLFIYYYLFERFEQAKKQINSASMKRNVASEEILASRMNHIENRICVLQAEIVNLRKEQYILNNYKHKVVAIKMCPFNKRTPDTYHNQLEVQSTFRNDILLVDKSKKKRKIK